MSAVCLRRNDEHSKQTFFSPFSSFCVFFWVTFLPEQDVELCDSGPRWKSLIGPQTAHKDIIQHSNDTPGAPCKSEGREVSVPESQLESRGQEVQRRVLHCLALPRRRARGANYITELKKITFAQTVSKTMTNFGLDDAQSGMGHKD